jgi:hypothetical protein
VAAVVCALDCVLKGSSRVFEDELDWKRRCVGWGCVRCAQKTHGAACRGRNGEMEDCGVGVRSLRVAVERIDRILIAVRFACEVVLL